MDARSGGWPSEGGLHWQQQQEGARAAQEQRPRFRMRLKNEVGTTFLMNEFQRQSGGEERQKDSQHSRNLDAEARDDPKPELEVFWEQQQQQPVGKPPSHSLPATAGAETFEEVNCGSSFSAGLLKGERHGCVPRLVAGAVPSAGGREKPEAPGAFRMLAASGAEKVGTDAERGTHMPAPSKREPADVLETAGKEGCTGRKGGNEERLCKAACSEEQQPSRRKPKQAEELSTGVAVSEEKPVRLQEKSGWLLQGDCLNATRRAKSSVGKGNERCVRSGLGTREAEEEGRRTERIDSDSRCRRRYEKEQSDATLAEVRSSRDIAHRRSGSQEGRGSGHDSRMYGHRAAESPRASGEKLRRREKGVEDCREHMQRAERSRRECESPPGKLAPANKRQRERHSDAAQKKKGRHEGNEESITEKEEGSKKESYRTEARVRAEKQLWTEHDGGEVDLKELTGEAKERPRIAEEGCPLYRQEDRSEEGEFERGANWSREETHRIAESCRQEVNEKSLLSARAGVLQARRSTPKESGCREWDTRDFARESIEISIENTRKHGGSRSLDALPQRRDSHNRKGKNIRIYEKRHATPAEACRRAHDNGRESREYAAAARQSSSHERLPRRKASSAEDMQRHDSTKHVSKDLSSDDMYPLFSRPSRTSLMHYSGDRHPSRYHCLTSFSRGRGYEAVSAKRLPSSRSKRETSRGSMPRLGFVEGKHTGRSRREEEDDRHSSTVLSHVKRRRDKSVEEITEREGGVRATLQKSLFPPYQGRSDFIKTDTKNNVSKQLGSQKNEEGFQPRMRETFHKRESKRHRRHFRDERKTDKASHKRREESAEKEKERCHARYKREKSRKHELRLFERRASDCTEKGVSTKQSPHEKSRKHVGEEVMSSGQLRSSCSDQCNVAERRLPKSNSTIQQVLEATYIQTLSSPPYCRVGGELRERRGPSADETPARCCAFSAGNLATREEAAGSRSVDTEYKKRQWSGDVDGREAERTEDRFQDYGDAVSFSGGKCLPRDKEVATAGPAIKRKVCRGAREVFTREDELRRRRKKETGDAVPPQAKVNEDETQRAFCGASVAASSLSHEGKHTIDQEAGVADRESKNGMPSGLAGGEQRTGRGFHGSSGDLGDSTVTEERRKSDSDLDGGIRTKKLDRFYCGEYSPLAKQDQSERGDRRRRDAVCKKASSADVLGRGERGDCEKRRDSEEGGTREDWEGRKSSYASRVGEPLGEESWTERPSPRMLPSSKATAKASGLETERQSSKRSGLESTIREVAEQRPVRTVGLTLRPETEAYIEKTSSEDTDNGEASERRIERCREGRTSFQQHVTPRRTSHGSGGRERQNTIEVGRESQCQGSTRKELLFGGEQSADGSQLHKKRAHSGEFTHGGQSPRRVSGDGKEGDGFTIDEAAETAADPATFKRIEDVGAKYSHRGPARHAMSFFASDARAASPPHACPTHLRDRGDFFPQVLPAVATSAGTSSARTEAVGSPPGSFNKVESTSSQAHHYSSRMSTFGLSSAEMRRLADYEGPNGSGEERKEVRKRINTERYRGDLGWDRHCVNRSGPTCSTERSPSVDRKNAALSPLHLHVTINSFSVDISDGNEAQKQDSSASPSSGNCRRSAPSADSIGISKVRKDSPSESRGASADGAHPVATEETSTTGSRAKKSLSTDLRKVGEAVGTDSAVESAVTEILHPSAAATASRLAIIGSPLKLLRRLVSSDAENEGSLRSTDCTQLSSQERASNQLTTPQLSAGREPSNPVFVPPGSFPLPKILRCVIPGEVRSTFHVPSVPPLSSPSLSCPLALSPRANCAAVSRRPSWNGHRDKCTSLPPRPPVFSPSSSSLSSPAAFLSSPLAHTLSTSAPAISTDTTATLEAMKSLSTACSLSCPASPPVILSLRTQQRPDARPAVNTGSDAALNTEGPAHVSTISTGASLLHFGNPSGVATSPPPTASKGEHTSDSAAAVGAALQQIARGLLQSGPQLINAAAVSEQPAGGLISASTVVGVAAATLTAVLATGSNERVASATEQTAAVGENNRVGQSDGTQEAVVSLIGARTVAALSSGGTAAGAQAVLASTTVGSASKAAGLSARAQGREAGMHINLKDAATLRQDGIFTASTFGLPHKAEPVSFNHPQLQDGVLGSRRNAAFVTERLSQPFAAEGTARSATLVGSYQQVQEGQQPRLPGVPPTNSSRVKPAFSREQLLGGVSIKRVKKVRYPQGASIAARSPVACVSAAPKSDTSRAPVAAADGCTGVHSTLETSRAAAPGTETPVACCVPPLKQKEQQSSTDANSAAAPVATLDRVRPPRGDSLSSSDHDSSYFPYSPVADGRESQDSKRARLGRLCDSARLSQFRRRRAAEAASAAMAAIGAARRQVQRDEQVARFLQELQARYTVFGDEEVSATPNGGPLLATSSGWSSWKGCSDDSGASRSSSVSKSSSRSGSENSEPYSESTASPVRLARREESKAAGGMPQRETSTETLKAAVAVEDVVQGGSSAEKVAVTDAHGRRRSRTCVTLYDETGSSASDADSGVSSFFSPSSSSSDSSRSPPSRRAAQPLRLLDQERQRLFRAAAAAASALHRIEHGGKLYYPCDGSFQTSRRCVLATNKSALADAASQSAIMKRRCQAVSSATAVETEGADTGKPTGSVCAWLRSLLLIKKALRRAEWARRRAVSTQGAAAAAVAAAAASGAFSNHLFDQQPRLQFRTVRDSSSEALRVRSFHAHDWPAMKWEENASFGATDAAMPGEVRSARWRRFDFVTLKKAPSAARKPEWLAGVKSSHITEEDKQGRENTAKGAAFLKQHDSDYFDSGLAAAAATASDENSCMSAASALPLAADLTAVRRVTAAALLQQMPKASRTSFRTHSRCSTTKEKRDFSATTLPHNYLQNATCPVAPSRLASTEQSCECRRTPNTAVPAVAGAASLSQLCQGLRCYGESDVDEVSQEGDTRQELEFRVKFSSRLSQSRRDAAGRSAVERRDALQYPRSPSVSSGGQLDLTHVVKNCSELLLSKPAKDDNPQWRTVEAERIDARPEPFAAPHMGSKVEVESNSSCRRQMIHTFKEACGFGASRRNSCCGSDMSSTRSNSSSRSPSYCSADDRYRTVDSGCAGMFLPTHTVEFRKKDSKSSAARKNFSSSSIMCRKWSNTVLSVAYHASLPIAAAGLQGGDICVCSLSDMRPTRIVPSPQRVDCCSAEAATAAVESVSWKHCVGGTAAGEEHLLAVGRRGGHVELLDLRAGESWKPVLSWKAHRGPVEKLKFLSTAACVTSSPTEMYVRFWDLRGKGVATNASAIGGTCRRSCSASAWCGGSRLAAQDSVKLQLSVRSSRRQCGKECTRATSPCAEPSRLVRSVKMDSGVSAFAISPGEELLAVACLCGEVQVFSLPLGPEPCEQLLSFPSVHELDCFSSLSFSRNGRGLLVCGERQFTPRLRAATRLLSHPFCEMWDLQNTKQRYKMQVYASFWKHLRRYGSDDGRDCDAADVRVIPGFLSQQQEWRKHLQAQRICDGTSGMSLAERRADGLSLMRPSSFELPLSFFPSCVAVSLNASSLMPASPFTYSSFSASGNRCVLRGAASSQCTIAPSSNGSRYKATATQVGTSSYLLYLNSCTSPAERRRLVRATTTNHLAGAACISLLEKKVAQSQTGPSHGKSLAVKANKTSQESRDGGRAEEELEFDGLQQHPMPLLKHDVEANKYHYDRAGVASVNGGQQPCGWARPTEASMLEWAQYAARLFYGPLGGDYRWSCRRFVCDFWRDKVVGVGGPLHLMGAFKQWDASTGYLDSCTVSPVSQNVVNSVTADPRGGPTLLTGGTSATSGCGELTLWGYFTVSQMEALDFIKT